MVWFYRIPNVSDKLVETVEAQHTQNTNTAASLNTNIDTASNTKSPSTTSSTPTPTNAKNPTVSHLHCARTSKNFTTWLSQIDMFLFVAASIAAVAIYAIINMVLQNVLRPGIQSAFNFAERKWDIRTKIVTKSSTVNIVPIFETVIASVILLWVSYRILKWAFKRQEGAEHQICETKK